MIEVLAAFLVFRITIFLVYEKGPNLVAFRFRQFLGVIYDNEGKTVIGKKTFPIVGRFFADVITCAWCCSVWVGVGVALLLGVPWWYGLAFSGVTIILVEKGL